MESFSFIISIAVLVLAIFMVIAFFNMSANIKEIKTALLPAIHHYQKSATEARRIEYYVAKAAGGNAPPELKALTSIIYAELIGDVLSVQERDKKYEDLKARYVEIYKSANWAFPPNIQQR